MLEQFKCFKSRKFKVAMNLKRLIGKRHVYVKKCSTFQIMCFWINSVKWQWHILLSHSLKCPFSLRNKCFCKNSSSQII